MPFLDGKPWVPSEPLSTKNFAIGSKVFRVNQTGELYHSYDQYVERLKLLQSNRWTSLKGTSGLNYNQAVLEESAHKNFRIQDSDRATELILKQAHHSALPLALLVQDIQTIQGSPTSDKENANDQAANTKSEPLTAELIRAILQKATSVRSCGDKEVWIAKPEYQNRYDLPQQLPSELENAVPQQAKKPLPNGEGKLVKSPKKPLSAKPAVKRKLEGSELASGGAKKKPKTSVEGQPGKAQASADPPPLRSMEEEEARLTEGTNKAVIFKVLKEAGSEGYTVAQIVEIAQKQGLKDYTDASKKLVSSVTASDPTFVRVRKHVYAIRALMGDKPYKAIGSRAPRVSKKSMDGAKAEGASIGNQDTGSQAENPKNGSPKPKKVSKKSGGPQSPKSAIMNGNANGTISIDSPGKAPPLRSIEEEEADLKAGTNKEVVFKILKEAGHEGFSVTQIMDAAKEKGLKEFKESQKNMLFTVLISNPSFVRVKKGVYALRALMGDKPYEAIGIAKTHKAKQKRDDDDGAMAAKGASKNQEDGGDHVPSIAVDEADVESRTKNEVLVLDVQKTLDAHRKALEKALASEQRAQERITAATQNMPESNPVPATPVKVSAVDALGPKPTALTPEQEAFKGDPTNAQTFIAHQNRLQELKAQLLVDQKAWDEKFEAAQQQDAKTTKVNELVKAQRALKSAKKRVADSRASVQSASHALKDAVKLVEREKAKKAAEEKKAADKKAAEEAKAQEKKAREEARIAERERKKAEALESKRYPMEDLQLLEELKARANTSGEAEPPSDVPLPEIWMSEEDSRATSGLLFVADFLSQFNKVLKIASPPYETFLELLNEQETGTKQKQVQDLAELYESLLDILLQEAEEDSEEEQWQQFLDRATLNEVLRRYLASQKETSPALFHLAVTQSALDTLSAEGIEGLTGHEHQVLLTFLCDDLLATEKMRDVLQERCDGSGDVRREMREAVAEKKGELKELLDAEKEKRKQERNEKRAAKKAKEEALKLQKAEAAAKAAIVSDVQDAKTTLPTPEGEETAALDGAHPQKPGALEGDAKKSLNSIEQAAEQPGVNDEDLAEEEEPSWELPPELKDYLGDPLDRKAMLTWRQRQQSARQKLEKDKEKWHEAARLKAKKREAQLKEQQEEEREKERAKNAAEEEVARQQEAYEKELEKFSIRKAPLGSDRHYRQYWYGIAGQRSVIYVERDGGEWAVISHVEDLDKLMAGLDKRGIRELALHAALEKIYPAVTPAMKKATKPKPGVELVRYSQRDRTQAVFFSPSKQRNGQAEAETEASKVISLLTNDALDTIVSTLAELQRSMSSWGVKAPEDGWKTWSLSFRNAKKEAKLSMQEEGSLENVHATLKTCLLEAEEMLYALTESKTSSEDAQDTKEEEKEGSPQAAESSEEEPPTLFDDIEERESWRHSVMEGKLLSTTAYLGALLSSLGTDLLNSLESPIAKPEPPKKISANKANGRPKSAGASRPSSAGAQNGRQAAKAGRSLKPQAAESKKSAEAARLEADVSARDARRNARCNAAPELPAGKSTKRKSGAASKQGGRVTRARVAK